MISVILDFSDEFIAANERKIQAFCEKFNVVSPTYTDKFVVITDAGNKNYDKWENDAVIVVEYGGHECRGKYIAKSLSSIDEQYINQVYCRKNNLSWTVFTTRRLRVREMTPEDLPSLINLYKNNVLSDDVIPLLEEREERERIRRYVDNMYGFYGYGLWIVEDHFNNIIGRGGIENTVFNGEGICEMAYFIDEKFRGKGLGYELSEGILNFAKNYGMEKIIIRTSKENTPSNRLAEKLGFSPAGEIKDGDKIRNVFSILLK